MSPGACTHRSTSASISSGQRTSTITLPGGVASSAVLAPGGLRCGSSMITTTTNPASASITTSRNTVPPASSSSGSRPCMALSELDRGGQQLYRAAFQQADVDHEPDVEEGTDQRGIESDRHAADQGGHHRPDRADV